MKRLWTSLILATLYHGIAVAQHADKTLQKNTTLERTMQPESSPTDGRISLRLAGNGSYTTILIGFIPEGTTGFDEGYDSYFINDGAVVEFFSMLLTTRLSIQALPELVSSNVSVLLGHEVVTAGTYTISIDAEFIDPNFDIILEDTYQSTFTDLRQSAYNFSATTGEDHNRFQLNFSNRNALHTTSFDAKNEVYTYFAKETLHIQTTRNDLQEVELFTLTGKRVLSTKFNDKVDVNVLSSGIYLLQLTTFSGEKINKKIIKNN